MPRVNGVQFWSPSVTRMKIVFSLGLRWVEMPPPGRAGAVPGAMGVMFWLPLAHRLLKRVFTSFVVWASGVLLLAITPPGVGLVRTAAVPSPRSE